MRCWSRGSRALSVRRAAPGLGFAALFLVMLATTNIQRPQPVATLTQRMRTPRAALRRPQRHAVAIANITGLAECDASVALGFWLCVGRHLAIAHGVGRVALAPAPPNDRRAIRGVNVEVANATLFFRPCRPRRSQPCVPCDLPGPRSFVAVGGASVGGDPAGRLRAALTRKVGP